jgi:hypothetical protein
MNGRDRQERRRTVWIRIAAGCIAVLMLLGVLVSSSAGYAQQSGSAQRDRYELHLDVLLEEQTVRVSQKLTYTNRTGVHLGNMMFGVYANVLRRSDAAAVESERFNDAFPSGYAPGGIDFMSIRVNGEKAQWGIQGSEELFLRVECDLQPGEQAVFSFEYYLLLPVCSLETGMGDLTWRLTGFYPIAAVWDEYNNDFALNGYTVMGDPVFSESADYYITLSLPETYALAAPGEIYSVNENGIVFYEIYASDIREAVLLFSRKMVRRTAQTDGGTEICVWANTAAAAHTMLNAARDMMNYLERTLGEYPWQRLTLMETEYLYSGVSYPGVIQVSHELCGVMEADALTQAVRTLCAQQYFCCMAGVNRNAEPWLSDGLSSYMALMYIYDTQGRDAYLREFNAQVLPALQITIPGGMTVDSTLDRFNSRMEYEMVVIDRCAVVLHDMRQTMRHDVFLSALREYIARTRSGTADVSDFLSVMNEISGRSWNEYLFGQMHNMDDYVSEGIEWYE